MTSGMPWFSEGSEPWQSLCAFTVCVLDRPVQQANFILHLHCFCSDSILYIIIIIITFFNITY